MPAKTLGIRRAILATAAATVLPATLMLAGADARAGGAPSQTANPSQIDEQTGGTITGRIVEARSGRPIGNATVALSDIGLIATGSTDADGRYVLRALKPGAYHLFVRAEGYLPAAYGERNPGEAGAIIEIRAGERVPAVDVGLQPAGAISGRVFAESGEGLRGVEIEVLADRYFPGGSAPMSVAFGRTEESGVFRVGELPAGEYLIRAYAPAAVRPSQADGPRVYAPTYFPQATRVEDAQPIPIGAGQDLSDVNFSLLSVTTRTVSGTLVDPMGSLGQARVVMTPSSTAPNSGSQQAVPVSADGTFRIPDVVPGNYLIIVEATTRSVRWPMQQITVDDDVSGLELVARRGAGIGGRLVRDGVEPIPFRPNTIRLSVETRFARPGLPDIIQVGGGPIVRPDWTFSVDNVAGPSRIQVAGLPAGWAVKAVRVEGADVTDQLTDFGEGVRREVEIVLTDRATDVSGLVSDRENHLVTNCTVIVFAEDGGRWKAPSRFVHVARPGLEGWYQIAALPPADYLAVAVASLPPDAWTNPKVLELLWSSATRFQLDEGERKIVHLKLSLLPDTFEGQR